MTSGSSTEAVVNLSARSARVQISIVDSACRVVQEDYGQVATTVPRGIYEFRFRLGPEISREFVSVEAGRTYENKPPDLSFPTVAPVRGTETWQQSHFDAARREAQRLTDTAPTGARVVIFVRTLPGDNAPALDASALAKLSLIDSAFREVDGFRTNWTISQQHGYASWSTMIPAGGYVLRSYREYPEAVDQALWLASGWQTLVFIPNLTTGPAPEAAAIHMDRAASMSPSATPEPDPLWAGPDGELLELLTWGLRTKTRVLAEEALKRLIQSDIQDPMLTLAAAYSHVLGPDADATLLRRCLGKLDRQIPSHPDIAAIYWLAREGTTTPDTSRESPEELRSATWPAMIQAGYEGLLRRDAEHPGTLHAESLAETAAAYLLNRTLWTSWRSVPQGKVEKPAFSVPTALVMSTFHQVMGHAVQLSRDPSASLTLTVAPEAARTLESEVLSDPGTQRVLRYLSSLGYLYGPRAWTEALADIPATSLATGLPSSVVTRASERITLFYIGNAVLSSARQVATSVAG